MTREEAIQELKVMRLWTGLKDKKEAIDVAIEALQEPERKHGRWIEKSKWQSGRWIK